MLAAVAISATLFIQYNLSTIVARLRNTTVLDDIERVVQKLRMSNLPDQLAIPIFIAQSTCMILFHLVSRCGDLVACYLILLGGSLLIVKHTRL